MPPRNNTHRIVMGVIALVLIAAGVLFMHYRQSREPIACFDFDRDTQYGDREVATPSNQGITLPDKITYYYEVNYLQAALEEEGFEIDPYEKTGGGVYAAAFYGPSTRSAVRAFQEKYDFAVTGQVDPIVSDKLRELADCEAPAAVATTTTP